MLRFNQFSIDLLNKIVFFYFDFSLYFFVYSLVSFCRVDCTCFSNTSVDSTIDSEMDGKQSERRENADWNCDGGNNKRNPWHWILSQGKRNENHTHIWWMFLFYIFYDCSLSLSRTHYYLIFNVKVDFEKKIHFFVSFLLVFLFWLRRIKSHVTFASFVGL